MALEACDTPVKAYWVCRQEAGLGVAWRCRGASDAMKACVSGYTGNTETYDAFRARRLSVLGPPYFAHKARMLEAKLAYFAGGGSLEGAAEAGARAAAGGAGGAGGAGAPR
jgi:hypothetical protein